MLGLSESSILLGLKVISKIPENCKISRSSTGICIDTKYTIPFIASMKRTINGDSRERTINDIKEIIELSINKCDEIINSVIFQKINGLNSTLEIEDAYISNKLDTEYIQQYEMLSTINNELINSILGLKNLKKKYYKDSTITSQLDIIIIKINSYTSMLNKKFFYH